MPAADSSSKEMVVKRYIGENGVSDLTQEDQGETNSKQREQGALRNRSEGTDDTTDSPNPNSKWPHGNIGWGEC